MRGGGEAHVMREGRDIIGKEFCWKLSILSVNEDESKDMQTKQVL